MELFPEMRHGLPQAKLYAFAPIASMHLAAQFLVATLYAQLCAFCWYSYCLPPQGGTHHPGHLRASGRGTLASKVYTKRILRDGTLSYHLGTENAPHSP
jgi:hypothetical protein